MLIFAFAVPFVVASNVRDTECYSGMAIQFIVHVILGYVDAAFQTSIVNPVDVLLYTISLTEGHPHVSNFGN